MAAPDFEAQFAGFRQGVLDEVERLARKILREHPSLDEYVMGMGTAFFSRRDHTRQPLEEDLAYIMPLRDLIDRWDPHLQLTGTRMKFTFDGPVRTTW